MLLLTLAALSEKALNNKLDMLISLLEKRDKEGFEMLSERRYKELCERGRKRNIPEATFVGCYFYAAYLFAEGMRGPLLLEEIAKHVGYALSGLQAVKIDPKGVSFETSEGRVHLSREDALKLLDLLHAEAHNNLANAYREGGEYAKAVEHHEKALEIASAILTKEDYTISTYYKNIGWAYVEFGNYRKGLENLNKALKIRLKELGEDSPSVGDVYYIMAKAHFCMGDADRTLELLKKAEGSNMFSKDIAEALLMLAISYKMKGDKEKASEYFNRILAVNVVAFGGPDPNVASSYNVQGQASYHTGDYKRALDFYEKSLDIYEKTRGNGHPKVAEVHMNIAEVYLAQKKYDESIKRLKKALKIYSKKVSSNHPYIARIYEDMAKAYEGKGDKKKAEEYFKRAEGVRNGLER